MTGASTGGRRDPVAGEMEPGSASLWRRSDFAGVVDLAEGRSAVQLAREAIARRFDPAPKDPAAFAAGRTLPPIFDQSRGVFVTLKQHPADLLRGCIGYPLPVFPLRVALPRAAVGSAFADPRFPPLVREELDRVVVEVSILSVPELVTASDPEEIVGSVVVGRDGLLLDAGPESGLLLPQVAVEERFTPEQFLEAVSVKAGLRSAAWRSPGARVRTFQADVFAESAPGALADARPFTPPAPGASGRRG